MGITSRLLTVDKAAEYLGVSVETIRRYQHANILRPTPLPHPSGVGVLSRILFDVRKLDEFVDACNKADLSTYAEPAIVDPIKVY